MGGRLRRYDFDLVLAADFRGSGEVAETVGSHLASLAGAGLQIGLLPLRDPTLPPSTPVHRRIAALAREHTAVPIPPEVDGITCRLLLVYDPSLLASAAVEIPPLQADCTLVVLARPLLARGGPAFDVAAAAARIEDDLARHQLWCPTTPAIRAQCREHAAGLALSALDLQPLEPIPAWRVERAPGSGRRPILGRMLRPDDDRLPAGRETLLAAYPTQPGLEMRFLGGELIAPKKKH